MYIVAIEKERDQLQKLQIREHTLSSTQAQNQQTCIIIKNIQTSRESFGIDLLILFSTEQCQQTYYCLQYYRIKIFLKCESPPLPEFLIFVNNDFLNDLFNAKRFNSIAMHFVLIVHKIIQKFMCIWLMILPFDRKISDKLI